MNTSQNEFSQISSGNSSLVKNRRDILLAIAELTGEQKVVEDRLTWLKFQIEVKRAELKNFDQ